ncbi:MULTISPECIES: LacI family DNA-binding transcriptional regulator [unclassified Plantibacter]|uniref:LacI family DNA-binding transcriptional regulator n=1 Tax=unclassified Plantibacter TaxID=2624265 RepID=UPI001E4933DF|nr:MULTISPECIES: LacI family DNA-binding transcriptional regulator [unclassified Plantibacter]
MATMRDVARLAGVSVATVSFVVNDSKPVSPATRLRVESAMVELDFRRNAVARALASRRTRIIALLFPVLQHRLSDTAARFFTGAAEAAAELGYTVVLWPEPDDPDALRDLTSDGLIDGVILMEVRLDDRRVDQLLAAKTPLTLIGRTRDPSGLDYVDVDFEGMVEQSIDRLQALGHRDLVLLEEPEREDLDGYGPVVRVRETFHAVCAARGLRGRTLRCPPNPAGGRAFATTLLEEAPEATALLVLNDRAAVGFVSELGRLGVSVPRDLSVVLIGSTTEVSETADPELAVLVSPAAQLGRMGVETLVGRLDGTLGELRHELVMGAFLEGASLAPPPG